MNKTINMNLAGVFFHIDEDAFAKLQQYLNAIKRSFTEQEGRQEIIQDIEARIAELFTEAMKHERQVIGITEVERVIEIMGQPEDYVLDDESYDHEPQGTPYTSTHTKKLYRDMDDAYVGGVSAGLGHYIGIDPVWIRILLIILTVFSSGGIVLLYIGFWIFVPVAKTTAEKLEMRGKPVNIDNIQRKVKESFDNVADSVKNADYGKFNKRFKRGSSEFAKGLSGFVLIILTVISKLLGVVLVLLGATTVIGLFIGLFTASTLGIAYDGYSDFFSMFNATGVPFWLLPVLVFFALGIPFFGLFYLGLKILINNLKRMPLPVKILLITTWVASVITLSVLGTRQAMDYSKEGRISQVEELPLIAGDTLKLSFDLMDESEEMWQDTPTRTYRDLRFQVRASKDSVYKIGLVKIARGLNTPQAKKRASTIPYNFAVEGNELRLAPGFTIPRESKLRKQAMDIVLYVPEQSTIYLDQNSQAFVSSSLSGLLKDSDPGHFLYIENGALKCTDCMTSSFDTEAETKAESTSPAAKYEEQEEIYEFDKAVNDRQKRSSEVEAAEKIPDTLSMK